MRLIRSGLTQLMLLIFLIGMASCSTRSGSVEIAGELRKWHKVTLTFTGPETSEQADKNPFLDYSLMVTFTNGDKTYEISGFYAADGNASETGASAGDKWQVRFTPDAEGEWSYHVSFREGENIAVSDDPLAGESAAFDGTGGTLNIKPLGNNARGFHAKGRLEYTGDRYLQFAESGEYFLKGGADSPENFLAYAGFDCTYVHGEITERQGEAMPTENLHRYEPHVKDWNPGDPTWRDGNGKGIIGALNYLASKGMNSVYFLTMNIEGDGKDVWPYVSHTERTRFDCSKLDQWEIVFDHMENLGLMLHMVLQETENERLLDDGDTGLHRKLYYRELIARFGHHLAITWNMGEENGPAGFSPDGQTTRQQKAMTRYIKEHDPFNSFVVIHTHSSSQRRYEIFEKLLGHPYLDGPAIQIGDKTHAHGETRTWLARSDSAGKQWVVNIDEIGPASRGVDPDSRTDNNQDEVRHYVLWGNLMAGGGGSEWYFGYQNPHNDLNCEDWRSREQMWDYTRHAIDFFQDYLPFREMKSYDELTTADADYVFASPGEVYAVYLPGGGTTELNLEDNRTAFKVKWYNPQKGGELQNGEITTVTGPGLQSLGSPPADTSQDWVVLITAQ